MGKEGSGHRGSPQESLSPPRWEQGDARGAFGYAGRWVRNGLERLSSMLLRHIVFGGNRVAYWRHMGVRIGSHCDIQTDYFSPEPWLVEIGNRVTVAQGVYLITHDGSSRVFRDTLPGSSIYGNRFGSIRILDNSFIGVNSIIMPDVEIGPNSIVGAGSVVTHNVPPNAVWAGVPAHFICSLDEHVAKYKEQMIPIHSRDRIGLRRELTRRFWGETR